jgi:hypothetical protein
MMCTKQSLLTSIIVLLASLTTDSFAGKGTKAAQPSGKAEAPAAQKRSTGLGKKKSQLASAVAVKKTVTKLKRASAPVAAPAASADRYGDLAILLGRAAAPSQAMHSFTVPAWNFCAAAVVESFSPYIVSYLCSLNVHDIQAQLEVRQKNLELLRTVDTLNVQAVTPEHQPKFWKLLKELMLLNESIEESDQSPEAIKAILEKSALLTWADEFGAAHPLIGEPAVAAAVAYSKAAAKAGGARFKSAGIGFLNFFGAISLSDVIKSFMNSETFQAHTSLITTTLNAIHKVLLQLNAVELPAGPCQEAIDVLEHYGLKQHGTSTFRRTPQPAK